MTYLPEPVLRLKVERESRILYRSKDKRKEKAVDALDRPAAMCSPIPDRREQMVRYYGFHSHVTLDLDFEASAAPASP